MECVFCFCDNVEWVREGVGIGVTNVGWKNISNARISTHRQKVRTEGGG